MKSWKQYAIGEVCTIYNGGTPDTKVKEYWGDEIHWITPKDMGKLKEIYVDSTERKISVNGLRNSSAKILPINSVVLSSRAPIGHLAINTIEMCTNQGCKGIVPCEGLDTKFLYYFLKHSVELLDSLGTGTTFKELSGKKLAEVTIPFPSLKEQKQVVVLLDEAFAAIDKAKQNAEKNLQNAKELFDSYLAKHIINNQYTWKSATLEEVTKFIDYRGRTPVKTSAGVRLITAKNVKKGYLEMEPQEFIASKDYGSWMTRGIPDFGDVIFTTEAPLANVAQIEVREKLAFAQRIIVMQPDRKKLNATFLKYLLVSTPVQKAIIGNGTGATVQGIKSSLLKKINICFPSLTEQEGVVKQLDFLWNETRKLQDNYMTKAQSFESLKKSILQKAFTGELTSKRIPELI